MIFLYTADPLYKCKGTEIAERMQIKPRENYNEKCNRGKEDVASG